MSAPTEQFNSSKGDFGATMRHTMNMIRGKDMGNYTLVFMDGTAKNPAGSHETIFNPSVILGRGKNCQVRFGDQYKTVSREHACINISGNQFVLFHNPNAKNPTLVNGTAIGNSYELRNGDEIKLSHDGPRMRFNIANVKPKTMALTSRIGTALGQATRPYKRAILLLTIGLVAALCFGGYAMYSSISQGKVAERNQDQINQLNMNNSELKSQLASMEKGGKSDAGQIRMLKKQIKDNEERLQLMQTEVAKQPDIVYVERPESRPNHRESVNNFQPTRPVGNQPNSNASNAVSAKYNTQAKAGMNADGYVAPETETNRSTRTHADGGSVKSSSETTIGGSTLSGTSAVALPDEDVFYIYATKVEVTHDGNLKNYNVKDWEVDDRTGMWTGTGFLTKDGDFVTARHVIQPWRFYTSEQPWMEELSIADASGGSVKVTFEAMSTTGKTFTFDTKNAVYDESKDVRKNIGKKKNGLFRKKKDLAIKRYTDISTDWAYITLRNKKGGSNMNTDLAASLPKGTQLYTLSYSLGLNAQAGEFYRDAGQIKYEDIEPLQGEAKTTKNGTSRGVINVTNQGFAAGGSGGPVFAVIDDDVQIVGLISGGFAANFGVVIPVSNLR